MQIEAKIINTGTWEKIQLVKVTYGYSQHIQNNQWVNTTAEPQRFEDEILTLGNYFADSNEALSFMQTKFFKTLFKHIQKNCI